MPGSVLDCLDIFSVALHGDDVPCGFPRWQVELAGAAASWELAKLLVWLPVQRGVITEFVGPLRCVSDSFCA